MRSIIWCKDEEENMKKSETHISGDFFQIWYVRKAIKYVHGENWPNSFEPEIGYLTGCVNSTLVCLRIFFGR